MQGSLGLYFNPGLSGESFGLGVYSSQGGALGFNVGAGAYVGILHGNACLLDGNTVDTNAAAGPVQASMSIGTEDKTLSATLGVAVGIPAGISVSYSHTESFGVEDIAPLLQSVEFRAMNAAYTGSPW